jgi:hypothetical protein
MFVSLMFCKVPKQSFYTLILNEFYQHVPILLVPKQLFAKIPNVCTCFAIFMMLIVASKEQAHETPFPCCYAGAICGTKDGISLSFSCDVSKNITQG